MKLLPSAFAALFSLFAASAFAQWPVYDNTNWNHPRYYTPIGGNDTMGDEISFQLDPFGEPETLIQEFYLYAFATTPGTYTLTMSLFEGVCFTDLVGSVTVTVNAPTAGGYEVSATFPDIVCTGPNPRWIQFSSTPAGLTYVYTGGGGSVPLYGTSTHPVYIAIRHPLSPPLTCADGMQIFLNSNLFCQLVGIPGSRLTANSLLAPLVPAERQPTSVRVRPINLPVEKILPY